MSRIHLKHISPVRRSAHPFGLLPNDMTIRLEVPDPRPETPPSPAPSPGIPDPGPEPPLPTPERPPLTDPEPAPPPIGDPVGGSPGPQALFI